MRLKIFSCHNRRPTFACNTEIFQTLVSNLRAPDDGSFMSDLGGINMAENDLYSELRHQFFVWKNLIDCYDYIGFEHYRRPFFIDTLPAKQLTNAFNDIWDMRLYFAAFNNVGLRCEPEIFQQYLDHAAVARPDRRHPVEAMDRQPMTSLFRDRTSAISNNN